MTEKKIGSDGQKVKINIITIKYNNTSIICTIY